MYTQQEAIANKLIYDRFKNKRIVFSHHNSESMGLIQKDTVLKIGMDSAKGALVSATMNDMVILAKITEPLQKKIYVLNGMVTLQLKFYDALVKKILYFNLYTKMLNINNQGLDLQDMYYMSVKLRRQIPDDLIHLFGKHHKKVLIMETKGHEELEGMLFSRGVKKICTPSRISDDTIYLNLPVNPIRFLDRKAMVVLKSDEEGQVYELIGKISNDYSEENSSFQIKMEFSKDQQSPNFNKSLPLLKKTINS